MDFAVESRGRKLENSRCRRYQPYGASVRHCGCKRKAANPEISLDFTSVHELTPFGTTSETMCPRRLLWLWAHAVDGQILRVIEKQWFILSARQKLFQLILRMLFLSFVRKVLYDQHV